MIHIINKLWMDSKAWQITILFLASIVLAFLSHLFLLSEWVENRYMVGMNDGLSQMLPFKRLLYDAYTNGDFFYSYAFGMGGGTYSQLGYYFSTSIVFIITVIITYGLESLDLIGHPDLSFWADTVLIISIVRMACIITVTTLFFLYIQIQKIPAFVGAIIYGTSVIYFRHVQYWEFFADAMLWLPILLFGIEKIIREKKAGWFIAAVAISVFDNFYFAYVNFSLAGVYIVFRWLIPFSSEEQNIGKQVKQYILGAIAGFGIGAVSFIPAVYGYLNNYRQPYEDPISLVGFPDNILLDGRIIVLPAFAIICLFLFSLYKNRFFRFFACLTIFTILMHYSPKVASILNGLSAPQYRWEYFMTLIAGAMVAIGLQQLDKVTRKGIFLSVAGALLTYVCFYFMGNLSLLSVFTFRVAYLAVPAILILILVVLYGLKRNKWIFAVLTVLLLFIAIFTSNGYQSVKLSHAGTEDEVSRAYMVGDTYNGSDTRALIQKIKKVEENPLYRIDWMYPTRNNTPITQHFNGFSAYSSILNQDLLFFYYYDLEIDMSRESVSRYGTLGDRANLYSVLAGKYYIAEKGDTSIPYGFERTFAVGDYIAYENSNVLPIVRTTKTVFTEEDLANASSVEKERAMIEGIILQEGNSSDKEIPESDNIIEHVKVLPVGSTYQENILDVTAETGGLDLLIGESNQETKDYFVSFYLKSLEKNHFFRLHVNDFETSRKSNISIYKTGVYDITIRVAADEKISIRVPEGKYKLANLELYEEDYRILESAKEESEQHSEIPLKWSENKINIDYNNKTNEKYMMLPIPYEKGWRVYVNGEKREILEANYAFIGLELEDGINEIELIYYPPYFFISLWITILTLTAVGLVCWWLPRHQGSGLPLNLSKNE